MQRTTSTGPATSRRVQHIAGDRIYRQIVSPLLKLGQQGFGKIDGLDRIAEPGQGDGMRPGAAAEIDAQPTLYGFDAEAFKACQFAVQAGIEIAEHPAISLRQKNFVMVLGACHPHAARLSPASS